MSAGRGLIIAAPASGSGKTTVTLGLLRALRDAGLPVRGAKSGPDYIDPRFHEAACGAPCLNLDAWAMTPARIAALAGGPGYLIIEGAMGLFDGAPPEGRGACADLARQLRLPVVLVVDAARMAQSIAPLVAGFAGHDPEVEIAGVILNKVGSARHETMLRRALAPLGLPVLGAVPSESKITQPSRHLGLMQAEEREDLEAFIANAGALAARSIDLSALTSICKPLPEFKLTGTLAPPAQNIAIAKDRAFAFAYPHLLRDWQAAGAELRFFSPLADEPVPQSDFLFLPGGYPELYAGQLSGAETCMNSIQQHADTKPVYGECGGYMMLGDGMIDETGKRHQMAGLLRLETSFATRKLHLGYREIEATRGPLRGAWAAHEFHYASTLKAKGAPLFLAQDAEGQDLHPMGLIQDRVCGSFAHIIDQRVKGAQH